MIKKTRYKTKLWFYMDSISYFLLIVWIIPLNFFASCYVITTKEKPYDRFISYLLKGPLYLLFCIILFPFGICGIILWLFVCSLGKPVPYSYWETPLNIQTDYKFTKKTFSISTANLCLLPECLSKFNNNGSTYTRSRKIASRIISGSYSNDIPKEGDQMNFSITTNFPSELDFICFQEVWERVTAGILIATLKLQFNFFLYDVGEYSWRTNAFCLGSGLMFASKYPISEASFRSYSCKTAQGRLTSLGLLQVKVVIKDAYGDRKVGYIATTHLQSYQGTKPCLLSELDEVRQWLKVFKTETLQEDESIMFDVFCGDLNFDNLSPGDQKCSEHSLFNDYADPCRINVGKDVSWAIGTEMRQLMLWEEDIDSPEKFKKMLEDPVLRRRFLLDADVEIQTMQLAFLKPPLNANGTLEFSSVGGLRRVDYLLYAAKQPLEILQYSFITALNQLTDHLPVAMTFTPQF